MLSYLLNPIISAIIAGVLSLLLYKLDSKITGTDKSKVEYIKIFMIISLITGLLVYLISMNNDLENIKSSIPSKPKVLPDSYSSDLPNF